MDNDMEKFFVLRKNDNIIVLLLKHKDGSGWSFVNLTKGHICPCKFDSKEEAMKDMKKQENVISFISI